MSALRQRTAAQRRILPAASAARELGRAARHAGAKGLQMAVSKLPEILLGCGSLFAAPAPGNSMPVPLHLRLAPSDPAICRATFDGFQLDRKLVAFVQLFSRSNAIFRNAVGYLLTFSF